MGQGQFIQMENTKQLVRSKKKIYYMKDSLRSVKLFLLEIMTWLGNDHV